MASPSLGNVSFPVARADINTIFQNLDTINAGTSEPTDFEAYSLWLDTSTTPAILKIRDASNTAWENLSDLIALNNVEVDGTLNVDGQITTSTTPALTDNSTKVVDTNWISQYNADYYGKALYNIFVNGDMKISQENGSSASTASSFYPADQWFVAHIQDGTVSAQRGIRSDFTDTPEGCQYYLSANVTATDTSLGAGQYYLLEQKVEGYRFADTLFGTANAKDLTLVFYVRSTRTGTFSVALRNVPSNRCFVSEFTINSADTWERKEITIPGDTSGTWAVDNTESLRFSFCLAAGSSFATATTDSWQSGVFAGSTTQDNGLDTIATFFFTGVQLFINEPGVKIPDRYIPRTYQEDLIDCLRYFQVHFSTLRFYSNAAGQNHRISWSYHLPMRASATITLSGGTPNNVSGSTANSIGVYSMFFEVTSAAAGWSAYSARQFDVSARM